MPPPRAFLSPEEMHSLSSGDLQRAVAEWESHLERVKRERAARETQIQHSPQAQRSLGGGHRGYHRGRGQPGRGHRGRVYRGGNASRGNHYGYSPYDRPHSRFAAASRKKGLRSENASTSEDETKSPPKSSFPCAKFTRTGTCARNDCNLVHDVNKTAICPRFVKKICQLGEHCDLSHTPSPHNMPACRFFQIGQCSKDDCPYAHTRTNPAAQVCEAFGRMGYCDKGAQCHDRHVFECPDYANKGICRNGDDCLQTHVRHAGKHRRSAGNSLFSETSTPKPLRSPTGTNAIFQDDAKVPEDEDGDVEVTILKGENDHDLSKQADFIALSP
ncbi:hypothetical protein EJ04DRAFT_519747 [Polyplosphaeria fusca]|uniref:C3H1-type domain-containing protein n=1 Tax=Polyplosphaeria fusca TaxID=682080 RepID=A0A9P4V770_9PLEO|nr:hypothetical protein EJ04DRAFT_519747 [Polyplosphaeria fusca]